MLGAGREASDRTELIQKPQMLKPNGADKQVEEGREWRRKRRSGDDDRPVGVASLFLRRSAFLPSRIPLVLRSCPSKLRSKEGRAMTLLS